MNYISITYIVIIILLLIIRSYQKKIINIKEEKKQINNLGDIPKSNFEDLRNNYEKINELLNTRRKYDNDKKIN